MIGTMVSGQTATQLQEELTAERRTAPELADSSQSKSDVLIITEKALESLFSNLKEDVRAITERLDTMQGQLQSVVQRIKSPPVQPDDLPEAKSRTEDEHSLRGAAGDLPLTVLTDMLRRAGWSAEETAHIARSYRSNQAGEDVILAAYIQNWSDIERSVGAALYALPLQDRQNADLDDLERLLNDFLLQVLPGASLILPRVGDVSHPASHRQHRFSGESGGNEIQKVVYAGLRAASGDIIIPATIDLRR
jgi:hypothetical protein